jgi:hypothetical protein
MREQKVPMLNSPPTRDVDHALIQKINGRLDYARAFNQELKASFRRTEEDKRTRYAKIITDLSDLCGKVFRLD